MEKQKSAQNIQYLFWQLHMDQYLKTVAELTGDNRYYAVIDRLLPYTALTDLIYDFEGGNAVKPEPDPEITVGALLTAAQKMLDRKSYADAGIKTSEKLYNISCVGRQIIEELIIYPLAAVSELLENNN